MKKIIRTTVYAGMCVLAVGALAGCNGKAGAEGPQYATVVSSTPIKKTTNHPTQNCHDVITTHHKPAKDTHQIAGTAIGAVIGGVLGHQVGGGKGKTLATVAGAVGGGYAGKKVQEHEQNNNTYTSTQRQCSTVNHRSTTVVGYKVTYKYNGTTHTTRMDHDPGDRIQVKSGVSPVGAN